MPSGGGRGYLGTNFTMQRDTTSCKISDSERHFNQQILTILYLKPVQYEHVNNLLSNYTFIMFRVNKQRNHKSIYCT